MDRDPDTGTRPHNLSTEHQKSGDARHPRDTLDKPKEHWAKDFQPGRDEGEAEPSD